MNTSPFSRLATNLLTGLVSTVAQTFAGAKTFLSTLIASAGVQLGVLFNTNGSGASDIAIQAGTSLADGSVNATAKLFSVGTGIGGSYVESMYINKVGAIVFPRAPTTTYIDASNGWGVFNRVYLQANVSQGLFLNLSGGFGLAGQTRSMYLKTESAPNRLTSGIAAGYGTNSGDVLNISGGNTGVTLHAEAVLHAFNTGTNHDGNGAASQGTQLARVMASGRIDQSGTDSSGSPGAATINKPRGRSAIAATASSVVITNNLVTAATHVHITPIDRDTTCKELTAVAGSGSFTVSGSAIATATLKFNWVIAEII